MSYIKPKDVPTQQNFDTIERRILKLPELEIKLEDLVKIFVELHNEALSKENKLSLSDILIKIVKKGKELNREIEAKFISRHSVVYYLLIYGIDIDLMMI